MKLKTMVMGTLLALGTGAVAERMVSHEQGTTVLDDSTPETVVVFDIGLLDTLDALDVPVAGLPRDFVPDSLSRYRSEEHTHVGSLFEPDYETVAAMSPDLILVANRSAAAYEDLSGIAPTLDLTVWGEGFLSQFRERTRLLAEIFDREAQTEEYLQTIDDKVEAARALAPEAGEALIVMTSGGRLTAYGPGSRFGLLHDELGLASAASDLEDAAHGDPISFEFVLDRVPDYIFVLDRDGAIDSAQAAARATMDNDLIRRTQAYRNDRIVYLDSVNWYIVMSGVNAVDGMVSEVLDALQP